MTVAMIEGLGSFYFGQFLRRTYYQDLVNNGHIVGVYPWTVKKLPPVDVIIGHSMGGGYAILNNFECNMLITFDARRWAFWQNDDFEKPSNAGYHANFYQESGLRGYQIKGAKNYPVINTSHITLPRACKPFVLDELF